MKIKAAANRVQLFSITSVLICLPIITFADTPEHIIARTSERILPKLIELRRDLHMHPGLSNQERCYYAGINPCDSNKFE